MIPFAGELADVAKVANKADDIADAVKVAKNTDNLADAVNVGDKVHNVAEVVDGANDANKTISKSFKYPGNNPTKSPGEGFEWRGKSTPNERQGNWFNPNTKEKWNADLEHGDPIGPHWDYTDANGNKYWVFPDGRTEKK